MWIKFYSWLMILIGTAHMFMGSMSYSASARSGIEQGFREISEAGTHVPLSVASPCENDNPVHDQNQSSEHSAQHQKSHNCHFGHCPFVAVTAPAVNILSTVCGYQTASSFTYSGVDPVTPSRPPSA